MLCAQKNQLVQLRRMYLGVLGNSLRQRRQLLQKLHVRAGARLISSRGFRVLNVKGFGSNGIKTSGS